MSDSKYKNIQMVKTLKAGTKNGCQMAMEGPSPGPGPKNSNYTPLLPKNGKMQFGTFQKQPPAVNFDQKANYVCLPQSIMNQK